MNEYEIYALKKTEKVKDKIIFECSFKSSFLQYSFRVGYRCGKRSGHIIGKKYYWLFGWHLFEEKNVNL
jgi:hypothetical protein